MPLDSSEQLRQFTEEVAQMILDLEEHASAQGEARLATWVTTSPIQVDAYLRTIVALGEFARIDAMCEAAKRRAVASTGDSRTLSPVTMLPRRVAPSFTRASSRFRATATAVGVAVGAATLVGFLFGYFDRHEVTSQVPSLAVVQHGAVLPLVKVSIYDRPGFVRLGPDSLLRLGNDSRVEVTEFTARRGPSVAVIKGVVWFSGHHDPQNPLSVAIGSASLDITGSQVEIERAAPRNRVTILEGEIRLNGCGQSLLAREAGAPGGGSPTITLTPTRAATFDDQDCEKSLKIEKIDSHRPIKGVVFSPDGKTVEFHDVTVGVALESLNRVHPDVLIVADTSLQDLKFWGRFPTNPDGFIRLLQRMYKIHAERDAASAEGYTLICLKATR